MKPFQIDIDACIEQMNKGGLILYPTDTIWGIGCDATQPEAIKKIYALKKRAEKKSMIILVKDENMLREYVREPSQLMLNYISHQLNPTTAIFQHAINLPSELINEDGTIAIRIIKNEFCEALLSAFKKPIISTSANISGEKYPEYFSAITEPIKKGVDYIVQHLQNDITIHSPSSIIKMNDSGEIEKLR